MRLFALLSSSILLVFLAGTFFFISKMAASPIKPKMVLIKGGCFEMGDSSDNDFPEAKPAHTVCLNDFYLGETEVTQDQWVKVMGSDPFAYFRSPDRPVEEASWDDAQLFIQKLNEQTKMIYRLPTEAEWEYAAREGGKKERWAGTDLPQEINLYAWYSDNSKNMTHPVKQMRPNLLGLYDMSGNVWEWVQDWYDEKYYEKSPKENPQGPLKGKYFVLRGGSYNSKRDYIRVDYRFKDSRDKRFNYFCGFRLALSAPDNDSLNPLKIETILLEPDKFDGKSVKVSGTVHSVVPGRGRRGSEFMIILLESPNTSPGETLQRLTIYSFAIQPIKKGTRVIISGVYHQTGSWGGSRQENFIEATRITPVEIN